MKLSPRLAASCAAPLLLTLLVACGGGGGSTDTTPVPPTPPTPPASVTRQIWLNNWDSSKTWKQVGFTRAYQNDRVNVWIPTSQVGLIDATRLQTYGDYFRDHSWPDVTTNAYLPTEYFGEAGNRINILFYKFYQEDTSKGTIAGFFFGVDLFDQASLDKAFPGEYKTNLGNYFYVNTDTSMGAADTAFTKATLTHEFQHMVNAHYFTFDVASSSQRGMDAWANEMCSITLECIYAGQMADHLGVYAYNPRKVYTNGQSDFMQWRGDATQYTGAALMGNFIYSQVPTANRPNFFKTFYAKTGRESATSPILTSVEDLLATLQDSRVGFTPAGWKTVTDFSTDTAGTSNNWSALMSSFGRGLLDSGSSYRAYLKSMGAPDLRIPLVTTGTSIPMNPGAFVVARTYVADLASTSVADASDNPTGRKAALMFAFNGTLPSSKDIRGSNALPTLTLPLTTGQLLTGTSVASSVASPESVEAWIRLRAFEATPTLPRLFGLKSPQFSAAPATPDPRPLIPAQGDPANGKNTVLYVGTAQ